MFTCAFFADGDDDDYDGGGGGGNDAYIHNLISRLSDITSVNVLL